MEDWSKIFDYNESSPSCLRWKIKPARNVRVGDDAGCLDKSTGYYIVGYNRKTYCCHRVVWELFNEGIDQYTQVDHVNGVSIDNNILNLRLVTARQNMQNRKMQSRNKSEVTGVCLTSKDNIWVASWYNLDRKQRSKGFSVNKYGYDLAFQLACDYRARMIQELNSEGSDYTARHGT